MGVRHLLASLMIMGWAVLCRAAGPFFCTRQGAELLYERTEVASGKLRWSHRMSINKVTSRGDGSLEIAYSSLFRRAGGMNMYGGSIPLEVTVTAGGDVRMDAGESVASVFANYMGEDKVSSQGGETLLPSAMKPGDVLPDVHCSVKASVLSYRVDVTERKVLREETLKTPAGEFSCVVLSEHKVEKGAGRNRTTTALTWYAPGVGMVRHDTYDARMKLETSEVLKNIK